MLRLRDLKISFGNGVINTPLSGTELRDLYNFIREAFLSGLLPVTKIIGFKIEGNDNESCSLLDRYPNLSSNNLEISSRLESLCFIGNEGVITIDVKGSVLTSDDIDNNILYDPSVRLVNPTTEIFRVIQVEDFELTEETGLFSEYNSDSDSNIVLKLILRRDSGFKSMTDNLTYMLTRFNDTKDVYENRVIISEFMPINSNHSLSKFIRFLPFLEGDTEIKYKSELDTNLLNTLWNSFLDILHEKGVEE